MVEPSYRNSLKADHRLYWYAIKGVLGRGESGITYRAYDANLSRQVVIKEFLPADIAVRTADAAVHAISGPLEQSYRERLQAFVVEARSLAKFNHPAIARIYSVFEANNTAYRVTHYLEGESLRQRVERTRALTEGQVRQLLLPILDGLELVHANGLVHRDIKPSNIFIRSDGSPLLLDFGSAKPLAAHTTTSSPRAPQGFTPFEQYAESADCHGPWTDIYSLAASLYWACTGYPPGDAIRRSDSLLRGGVDPLIPLSGLVGARYSAGFLQAIDHALAFDRRERPQHVAAWREELLMAWGAASLDGRDEAASTSGASTLAQPSHGEHSASQDIGTHANWQRRIRGMRVSLKAAPKARTARLKWRHGGVFAMVQRMGSVRGRRLSGGLGATQPSTQSLRLAARRVWEVRGRLTQWAFAGLLCALVGAADRSPSAQATGLLISAIDHGADPPMPALSVAVPVDLALLDRFYPYDFIENIQNDGPAIPQAAPPNSNPGGRSGREAEQADRQGKDDAANAKPQQSPSRDLAVGRDGQTASRADAATRAPRREQSTLRENPRRMARLREAAPQEFALVRQRRRANVDQLSRSMENYPPVTSQREAAPRVDRPGDSKDGARDRAEARTDASLPERPIAPRFERVERLARVDRVERIERPAIERPERLERVERLERPERFERPERPDRPVQAGR
jgi:serine/threonine protein kinase